MLLVLFSVWHGVLSLPVKVKKPMADSCVSDARALLENITDALTQDYKVGHLLRLFVLWIYVIDGFTNPLLFCFVENPIQRDRLHKTKCRAEHKL